MCTNTPAIDRRTALRTLAVGTLIGSGGCLSTRGPLAEPETGSAGTDGTASGPFEHVGVEGTTLVVELAAAEAVEQVNLIKPDGELWGRRDVATGADQVSFAFRGGYPPGEYDVVAVDGEETVAKVSLVIRPDLVIREVGLYRNHPEKPWEEVYGESSSDLRIDGEAFVTVENTGTGPESVVELRFTGDVPNPSEDPRSNGIQRTDRAVIPVGRTVDLYSAAFPFGSESPNGMGCTVDGNSGQFTVALESAVSDSSVEKVYNVRYSGSSEMADCEITISEAN